MILQCSKCKTRFRLDDSKLKPGGVKVRCSKCRNVFVAGGEAPPEESEFDAILSGLGAAPSANPPAPEAPFEAPLPKETQTQATDAVVTGFVPPEVPTAEPAEEPAPASPDFGFSFADAGFSEEIPVPDAVGHPAESEVAPAESESAPAEEVRHEPSASGPAEGIDFGAFSFDEAPAEEPPPGASSGGLDFGELSFEVPPQEPETAPEVTEGTFDFQELFADADAQGASPGPEEKAYGSEWSVPDEEVAAAGEHPESDEPFPAASEFSFGEGEPPVSDPLAPAAGDLDFEGFSFEETPVAPQESGAKSAEPELEFGEFSFEEGVGASGEASASAPPQPLLDFDEFSFEEPEAPSGEASTPAAAESVLDFGELSFEAEPLSPAGEGSAAGAAAVAPAPDFGEELFHDEAGQDAPPPSSAPVSFPGEEAAVAIHTEGEPQVEKPREEFGVDFNPALFGEPSKEAEAVVPPPEEELPPLAITSRRKGRSLLTVSLVTISVVMVLLLSGAGFYLMQGGPAAFEKVGLGFVAKWFGMESVEEGRITIRNAVGSFHQNKEAGELFVVAGEAVNSFKKARASIHVKVTLYDKAGKALAQKTAYCGNKLTDEQLATLPIAKLDAIMNNQFGDSLANLGVQPGRGIPFVIAVTGVPKEAADFGVEAVGSTVAGP